MIFQENTLLKIREVLESPKVRTKDALRIIALFTIRYQREVEKNLDAVCGLLKGLPV